MYTLMHTVHELPECFCLCQGLVIVHYIIYCAQLSLLVSLKLCLPQGQWESAALYIWLGLF